MVDFSPNVSLLFLLWIYFFSSFCQVFLNLFFLLIFQNLCLFIFSRKELFFMFFFPLLLLTWSSRLNLFSFIVMTSWVLSHFMFLTQTWYYFYSLYNFFSVCSFQRTKILPICGCLSASFILSTNRLSPRSCAVAHQIKALATQPDDIATRTDTVEEKNQLFSSELSFDLHICSTAQVPPH